MKPGIDPKIDIAFRKVFGSERFADLTAALINAVRSPPPEHRVVEVMFLNPYSEKLRPDDKLSVFSHAPAGVVMLVEGLQADPALTSIPILGSALAHPYHAAAKIGDCSALVDVGNIQAYPGGRTPEITLPLYLLLQKTNGDFDLAVWREVPVRDENARQELPMKTCRWRCTCQGSPRASARSGRRSQPKPRRLTRTLTEAPGSLGPLSGKLSCGASSLKRLD